MDKALEKRAQYAKEIQEHTQNIIALSDKAKDSGDVVLVKLLNQVLKFAAGAMNHYEREAMTCATVEEDEAD